MSTLFSNTVTILAAQVPSQPQAPVTTWSPDDADPLTPNASNVVVSWVAPNDGGYPILGYIVSIKQSDEAFSVDVTNCDMQASTTTQCTIPVATLLAAPFSLDWGQSVFATVSAQNIYGTSLTSLEGNGALLVTNPDVPLILSEDTV